MSKTNDASIGLLFEEQRRHIIAELEKIEYGELTGRSAVSTVREGGRGTSTVRQYVIDRAGVMSLRSNKGEDYNLIDISGSYIDAPIFFSESGFEYDIEELWAVQETNMNLDTLKAEATMEAYEEMVNRIIWVGQSNVGLTGLGNNANVDILTTAGSATLAALGAEATVQYFVQGYDEIYINSKQKIKANTLALPVSTYRYLKRTAYSVVSGLTTQTLLERILEITELSMNDVIAANELEDLGTGGILRAIWYDRTPRRVKFNEPVPIEMRPTQEIDNSFRVPTVAKVGGVWLKYPNAFKYLDYENE